MPSTWKHPILGTFRRGGFGWSAPVTAPAFAAFSYDTGYPNAPRSTGRLELAFADRVRPAPLPPAPPEPAAVDLALRLFANQHALVTEIPRALWASITGQGPDAGIGDLAAIAESVRRAGLPAPAAAEGLLPLLQAYRIVVDPAGTFGRPAPIAEISFHAAIEEEHGIGVLTDGAAVLGLGYAGDVTPFDYKPPRLGSPFGRPQ